MRDRPWLPPQRSIAISSALRTRTSSNGFFSALKADQQIERPAQFLDADLVAHRLHQAVALGRRDAAELGQHLSALQRVEHGGGLQREHALEAVEIGQALLEVVLVALAGDVAALDVLDEDERPGAVDLGLRRVRIGGEVLRRVDAVPGRGEVLEHRGVHRLHLEDDGESDRASRSCRCRRRSPGASRPRPAADCAGGRRSP